MGLSMVGVFLMAGSMSTHQIVEAQRVTIQAVSYTHLTLPTSDLV